MGKKLVSNTTFLLADWIIVSIFSFLFWLIIGKFLSKEDYGIIAITINTAILLSTVSHFGTGNTLTKLISEYIQRRRRELSSVLIKFSFKILLVTNSVIFLTLVLFSSQLSSILKISQSNVVIMGAMTFVLSFANVSGSIVQGFQDMRKIAISDTIGYFIKFFGTLVFLLMFLNNMIPILVFLASSLVIFLLRFDSKWLFSRGNHLNYRETVSKYLFPTFIAILAWQIFTNAQYLILTVMQDPATTGVFSVAAIVTTLIAVIPTTISGAFFPILSQMSVLPSFRKQREYLISQVIRYSLFVSIPVAIVFIFFPSKIIIFFARSEFLDATSLFPILSIAALFNGMGILFMQSLYAFQKVRLYRNIIIFTAVIFLSLALMLTQTFSAIGLAISFTVSMIFLFTASLYHLRKILKIPVAVVDLAKIVLAAGISISVFYLASQFILNDIFEFILLGFSALIYPFILLPLRFYRQQDIRILEFIRGLLPTSMKRFVGIIIGIISKFV